MQSFRPAAPVPALRISPCRKIDHNTAPGGSGSGSAHPMEFSLLCDEELPLTPLPSLSNSPAASHTPTNHQDEEATAAALPPPGNYFATPKDRDETVGIFIEKELSYVPAGRYVDRLRRSHPLASLRLNALRWIIAGCARMNYSDATTFRAVNYLDRFASVYCHMQEWQHWMMELLAVACLSIAAKLEEIFPATLQSLPTDDLDHSYDSLTIQRMELLALKALDWRLYSVTSYSYVDMLTWRLDDSLPPSLVGALDARVTELLLCALSDVECLGYRPSVIAMTAFKCGVEELCPRKFDSILSSLNHLIPKGSMNEMDRCNERMKSIEVAKWNSFVPQSPNTVMRQPRRRLELSGKSMNLDLLFGAEPASVGSSDDPAMGCKRLKR